MTDIHILRAAVKSVYPDSTTWPQRVDRMPAQQLQAIYLRFRREGKIR